jgi:hypothetical protein
MSGLRLPAYGRALWQRRIMGERPRVVALLVGDRWRWPDWLPAEIPRLAVKTAPWHLEIAGAPEAQKRIAREVVATALTEGTLVREPCEVCGAVPAEAHHPSYEKRHFLAVRWLCRSHHAAAHAVLKPGFVERFDWRMVAAMSVLAIDARRPEEVQLGPEDFDSWLWLLADVQRYARDVLMFTPTIEFADPPHRFAPERDLDVYAYLHCRYEGASQGWRWPAWWPYGDRLQQAVAA